MSARKPILLAALVGPGLQAQGQIPPQNYDTSYQLYQEDDNRIRIESYYIRGAVELSEATSMRVQWLSDAISGSSPTGALPGPAGGGNSYLTNLVDLRTAVLAALSQKFGDHRVELEVSESEESDYLSRSLALSDTFELNQKNTTVSYGLNHLDDIVTVPALGDRSKRSYDLFTGVSQILDKNTVVTANLTLGYAEGYLNDQYKAIQRTETLDDGDPFTPDPQFVLLYPENRPDQRFRQVLQLEAKRYFSPAAGALDTVLRFSNDDYGVFSQTLQVEWRQEIGENFQVIPFFRYYRQNAADFFVNSLDGVMPANVTPSADPDGSGTNYSADYRLSSLDAASAGIRLRCQIGPVITASASYERYVMKGTGSSSAQAPTQAYSKADIWTFGLSAAF
jgi:Protein of unknown function (DUF3570)